VSESTPLSEYEAAKNAAIDARLRLEDRLKAIEEERTQIRTLLGRKRRVPKAAGATKKTRKPAMPPNRVVRDGEEA
jgi:hypothetical protein